MALITGLVEPVGEWPRATPAVAVEAASTRSACSLGATPATAERTVTVDGVERRFRLTLPARAAAGPVPLVLAFHGYSSSPGALEQATGVEKRAGSEGFAVVLPEGAGAPSRWRIPGLPGGDDVPFVAALVDHLVSQACVDRHAVFAAGYSNGAAFAAVLACDGRVALAGAVLVGGASLAPDCPARPVPPVLVVHGTDDPVVPYGGGEVLGLPVAPLEAWIAAWSAHGRVHVRAVTGAGHAWPRPDAGGADATGEALQFMRDLVS